VSVEVAGGAWVLPGAGDVLAGGGVTAGDWVEAPPAGAPIAFVVSSDEVSLDVSVFTLQATTATVSAAVQKNLVMLVSY